MLIKFIGYISTLVFCVAFAIAFYLHYLWVTQEEGLPLSLLVYVLLLLTILNAVIFLKLKSSVMLWVGFVLFVFASLFSGVKAYNVGEPLFRFGLMFLIVGLTQSLIEYLREKS